MDKVAVLSNVNVDMVCKLLSYQYQVFEPQGYGNSFSLLLDPNSTFQKFSPQAVFFIVDLSELTAATFSYEEAEESIQQWFAAFQSCIDIKKQYFISNGVFRTGFLEDTDDVLEAKVELCWFNCLKKLIDKFHNIHCFHYKEIVMKLGKNVFFSDKLWYMGKIPFSSHGCKELAANIDLQLQALNRTPKKVLVLDLDNTLWGGVVGELGLEGILLSDDKKGAIYRDCQRIIKQMQMRGVLLAICSKNNSEDALEILEKHPHMVLRKDDFANKKINWETKPQNIQAMAKELNLGLDSMVFVDDMPGEREAVKSLLPMVEVPEFPVTTEELPEFFKGIYYRYFSKLRSTQEDLNKTQQYLENEQRSQLEATLDFDSFLKNLSITVTQVDCDEANRLRLEQMLHKTNQFNLTTKRYSNEQLLEFEEKGWFTYLFKAADKFGDYGIIAAVLVNSENEIPLIDSFVMSCRTMGKQIENYILDRVETECLNKGFTHIQAAYSPTAKNAPVKELYDTLGYEKIQEDSINTLYQIDLCNRPIRQYHVNES